MEPTIEHIEVTDPDDPMGMPAYGGPLEDMGSRLIPGVYTAYAHYSDESEGYVKVMVDADGNASVSPADEDED